MKRTLFAAVVIAALLPLAALAQSSMGIQPDAVKWVPAPPIFPAGAQIAVLKGDPGKDGLYVLRLKVPAGYKVPAHTHPQEENITVISGSINLGMGAKLDEGKAEKFKTGALTGAAKGMQHFAFFTEDTVIQIHGLGPQTINYVDPADDPRTKK